VEPLQIPLQQLWFPWREPHDAPVPRQVQFPLLFPQPVPQQSERHWLSALHPKPATSRHPAMGRQSLPEQQSSWLEHLPPAMLQHISDVQLR
jgi:hypothetical protein